MDVIAAAGGKLWKELVGNVSGSIKITSISLGFTGIDTLDESQQSIDGFFANPPGIKRPREDINDISQQEHKADTHRPKSTKRHRDSTASTGVSFTCSECHKTFSLPIKLQSNTDMNERTLALEAMKNEHSDFHFAESVARHVEPEMSKISRKPKQKDNGTRGNIGRKCPSQNRSDRPKNVRNPSGPRFLATYFLQYLPEWLQLFLTL